MKKICIVAANYYEDITKMLLKGAIAQIKNTKSKKILEVAADPILVPGIFEIPVTISKIIDKYDAFLALGCVIKGETPHFDFISKAAVNGIMELSIKNKKPIGNGIITCLNMKQAIERADPNKKNKGEEAVKAVLATLSNFQNE